MSRVDCFRTLLLAVVLSVSAFPAFAVEAPVYEADDYSSQTGDQGEAGVTAAPAAQPDQNDETESAGNTHEIVSSSLTLGQRVDRLEQQLDNLQHSDSSSRLNQLQEDLQALRGKVEELSHQLDQIQARQQTMYTDLDRRITAAATHAPSSTAAALPVTPRKKTLPPAASEAPPAPARKATQPNVAEEQQTYQLAYDLIKAEKYDQAISALQNMLQKYPSGQFAANAHYWLGELFGLQGKNTQAATEFQTVLKHYPGSPRIADAGLKLGLIYAAEQKWREAKAAFHQVINRYPGTASSRLAAEQLKQIKQLGH